VNLANVGKVFRKELRETIRDRRTLIVMLVVPIFLYPVLLIIVQQLALFGQRQLEEAPVTIVTQGGSAEALALLHEDPGITLRSDVAAEPGAIATGERDALLRFEPVEPGEPQRVHLYFDASRERSVRARSLAIERLSEWGDALLAERLAHHGLPADFAMPVAIADSSVASARRMGGYALGRFLPMILILMTLLGAFYPAIDLSAGEKERGTLETLLTAPIPPREAVAGKFLTVTVIALGAATLNLASMLLTFQYAALQFTGMLDIELRLPWTTILLVILFLVPLAVFFAAVFLGLALRAESFKEAQNALTPVQLASMVPMVLPVIPGMALTYPMAMVPIGGVALLFRELMAGEARMGPALVALATTMLYAGLALRFAAASFGREEVLFGSGARGASPQPLRLWLAAWRAGPRRALRPAEALAFVAVVALLYFYLGITLMIRAGEAGILLSQLLLLALPALIFVGAGPFRARETFALALPTGRQLAASFLVILGAVPIGWLLAWAQNLVMDVPQEFLTALQELIRADSPGEIAWLLLLVAFTPAICEELVFRGVLLRGLVNGMTPLRAVGLSAAIFGAFHLSTETAIRFLPSAWLGLLLGYAVWRTGSLLVGVVMHFVNNGLAVVLVAVTPLQVWVVSPEGQPRWALVVAGVVLLAIGLRALHRAPPVRAVSGASPPPPA
jgi:sodium transport system permease protein